MKFNCSNLKSGLWTGYLSILRRFSYNQKSNFKMWRTKWWTALRSTWHNQQSNKQRMLVQAKCHSGSRTTWQRLPTIIQRWIELRIIWVSWVVSNNRTRLCKKKSIHKWIKDNLISEWRRTPISVKDFRRPRPGRAIWFLGQELSLVSSF